MRTKPPAQPKFDLYAYSVKRLEELQAKSRADALITLQKQPAAALPKTAKDIWAEEGKRKESLSEQIERTRIKLTEEKSIVEHLHKDWVEKDKKRRWAIEHSPEIIENARQQVVDEYLNHYRCTPSFKRKLTRPKTLQKKAQLARKWLKRWKRWDAENEKKRDLRAERKLKRQQQRKKLTSANSPKPVELTVSPQ